MSLELRWTLQWWNEEERQWFPGGNFIRRIYCLNVMRACQARGLIVRVCDEQRQICLPPAFFEEMCRVCGDDAVFTADLFGRSVLQFLAYPGKTNWAKEGF